MVFELSSNSEAFNLFGSYDENLALLEDALDVKLVARGNNIMVSGSDKQVENAQEVLEHLVGRARTGPVSYTHLDVYKRQEVECAVLGNVEPKASVAGQILPSREFYDYEAKYMDEGTRLIIPAPLSDKLMGKVRKLAVAAFMATGCSGLARVDFFVNPDTGDVYVNELNTMPGFTKVSMYPKLWEASGVPYTELVRNLIDLALDRKKSTERHVHRNLEL